MNKGLNKGLLHVGGAYLEVMQQIMAAVQSASQLDVAQLIQDRTADGSLPPVLTTDASQHNDAAAAAAAAAVPGLAKRKALDTEQDGVQEAEGLQMRNAKRPRVEAGEGEQPQEAQKGQAGSGAAATQGLSAPKRGNGTSVTPIAAAAAGVASDQGLSTDGIALPDQATSTGPGPAGLDTAGNPPTKTGRRYLGSSSAAALDRLEQSHGRVSKQAGSGAALMASQPHEGNPEGSARAPPRDGAAGTSGGPSREQTSTALVDQHARGQPGASIAMPGEGSLQSTHPGPSSRDQPGPSSRDQPGPSTQDQAGPSSQDQPGPRATQIHPGASGGLPDQDMGEEADPEVKEKREQARNRIRYWRKVLLDGLDLQAELTAAAAAAGLPDSEVAEAEAKVGPYWWYHLVDYDPEQLCPGCCCSRSNRLSQRNSLTGRDISVAFKPAPPSPPPAPPGPRPPTEATSLTSAQMQTIINLLGTCRPKTVHGAAYYPMQTITSVVQQT